MRLSGIVVSVLKPNDWRFESYQLPLMYKPLSLQNNKIAYYFIIIIVRLCAFSLILVISNYHEYLTSILTLVKQIENSNFIDIIQAHTPAECGSRE